MSVGFIDHQGTRILLLDFKGLQDSPAILARIEEARRFVAQQPKRKEILTLVDVSKMRYDNEVLKAFQALTVHDEPWERAVAVCGLRGIGRVVFRASNLLTGGRLRGFEGRDKALTWLLQQSKP